MEYSPSSVLNDNKDLTSSIGGSNCRICLDNGMNPLMQPCKCIGTTKFVHEICLKEWIITKYTNIDGAQCEICQYKYTIIVEQTSKCSLKNALPKNISNLCVIITSLVILLASAIILGLFIKEQMDLERRKIYSITILSICSAIMGICLIFMARGIYKMLVNKTVSQWSIIPMIEKIGNT